MLKEEEECVHFQYSLNESTRGTNCDQIIILALGEITQGVSAVSLENSVQSFAPSIIAVVHEVVKLNETNRCYQ